MGIALYPPDSTSAGRKWTLISSVTASSSAVSFTSLPAYNYYRVVSKAIQFASQTSMGLRFNNDTSVANYAYYVSGTNSGYQALSYVQVSTQQASGAYFFDSLINYGDGVSEKQIITMTGNTNANTNLINLSGIWFNTAQINRIDVVLGAATTFTTGTISVYGSNV